MPDFLRAIGSLLAHAGSETSATLPDGTFLTGVLDETGQIADVGSPGIVARGSSFIVASAHLAGRSLHGQTLLIKGSRWRARQAVPGGLGLTVVGLERI